MKLMALALSITCAFAADKKPLPNQAGNDDIELVGTLILDRQDIQQELGGDLGAGYIVVRVKCTPKNEESLRISPDDFTLISRKDGERSPALSPTQIAGAGALVVKPAREQPGGDGTRTNGPIWGGIGAQIGGPRGVGAGSGNKNSGAVDAKVDDSIPENPILPRLKEKVLPDKETKDSLEGLLYFSLEGKLKPKDVSMFYKGAGGRLVMDFK